LVALPQIEFWTPYGLEQHLNCLSQITDKNYPGETLNA
jgi:hypothetical protein